MYASTASLTSATSMAPTREWRRSRRSRSRRTRRRTTKTRTYARSGYEAASVYVKQTAAGTRGPGGRVGSFFFPSDETETVPQPASRAAGDFCSLRPRPPTYSIRPIEWYSCSPQIVPCKVQPRGRCDIWMQPGCTRTRGTSRVTLSMYDIYRPVDGDASPVE